MPGNDLARAPVARMTCLVSITERPLAGVDLELVAAATAPVRGSSVAVPAMCVILFFLNRKPTPLLTLSAMPRLRWIIAGKSGAHVAGDDPELLGAVEGLEHLGRAQQRLGRDAAPVEADPTEVLALDAGGLEAELRAADRRDVAAGAGADHDDIVDAQS